MIIVLKKGSSKRELEKIVSFIEARGLKAHISKGEERTIVGAIGDERILIRDELELFPFVEKVLAILKPYKLVAREFHPNNTIIKGDGFEVGGDRFCVIAGPCAVESEEQLLKTAHAVKKAGANILRGSAFKPRSSPYSFQGLGLEGLKLLQLAKKEVKIPVETEVMDTRQVELVYDYVDILRIGARNMQNFDLLKECGKIDKPIILKRGISATIEEWLLAAEYILSEGNREVILCERGIRTFETATRNTLDISAVPVVKEVSHLPIIVDPSHSSGKSSIIPMLCNAIAAVGADGMIVEVHCDPQKALSDGKQSLLPSEFSSMMESLKGIIEVLGKRM